MRYQIYLAGILLVCGLTSGAFAQTSETHTSATRTITSTSTEAFRFAPNSDGANSVRQWLLERNAEGQLPDSSLLDGTDKAFFSGKITTTITSGTGVTADTIAPDGTVLPVHGVPGQTLTISVCVPRQQTVEYIYKWVPDSNGGHWELVEVKSDQKASTACQA